MVRAHTARFLAGAVFGVALASGVAACNSDGTTASCRTEEGELLPLYDINDVDDSGVHPDAEVERIRAELSSEDTNRKQSFCLTAVGHATSPEDSGSD
jgi:hypothetical protein